MMDVRGRTVIVVGLGRSGVAAARLLNARGARVIANDGAPRERLSAAAAALEGEGVVLAPGGHDPALFDGADLVVVSPGVPSFPALDAVARSGREVIGELELASRFVSAPVVLVGGTNGKSTTTALTGAMLERAGLRTFVGGNFGTPLAEVVDQTWDVLVLEISSFQAERVPTLHARAHALLNITDDHLDRYASFAAYADAKGNPFERMTPDDVAVVPFGDELVARQAARGRARVVTFSARDARADVSAAGGAIVDRVTGARYPLDRVRLAGAHNLANACASAALAAALGAPAAAIGDALSSFEGLAHRTALVADVDGVRYYDDSKGTNVGASVAALSGLLEAKAVLIAGGRDKLGDYAPLVSALRERGRALVVLGEAADRIAAAAAGVLPIARAGSMAEAVLAARSLARPGDAVLLSPACSSFDMFRDYKDRGDAFVRAVRELQGAAGGAAGEVAS
ncbi:UDP-N-acetylmuramoylalanine-D-glutamate ligase [Sorangium cellulosum So ce56]|uniref:UDP-N-acetylmuramoylalanine--D-glutamate ligase n=1 Tax=Sorangium cellulosum (strain So ce56) TaxID=448385 RepID=A9FI47_SORC5|nr:UDP-N-acetylmuramoyl-L-alanine--D-glutamate ligase [Sorangium cellulosum]CAN91820.1 UDP-N-acetylmuramoylalanine-D-glutamate ligase [Sorangium cellulosum So ce56]